MDNFLDNGAVLPSGLLSVDTNSEFGAFHKKYQNSYLRVGVITASYDIQDVNNINKVVPEYDVLVFEQNEDAGSTLINYKNCVAAAAFGSIADFFEARLRAVKTKTTKDTVLTPSGQNGAIVLLLCMNGFSAKGTIIGSLLHPDRKTTLNGSGPHLEGEYNGVNIKVNKDGSTALTFKGATDNDGKVVNDSQGDTTLQVEKDGSFQVDHDTITFRLDRNGTATLTAKKDTDLNVNGNINIKADGNVKIDCKNAEVTASQNATVTASAIATVEGKIVKLGVAAIESVVKGVTFKALFDTHIHPTVLGPSGPPVQPLDPVALSKKVFTE